MILISTYVPPLPWRTAEPDEVLHCEEDDDKGVDVVQDDDDGRVLRLPLVHGLELFHGGHDERHRGQHHHAEGEERHKLEKRVRCLVQI